MIRYFRVTPHEGDQPISIVADTLIDAHCQARELCNGSKPYKFREELFPVEMSGQGFSRFNDTMRNIFA